jgi:chitin disaccharide deacetylase
VTAGAMLIVNADDYGLTTAVSQGILHAHRQGVVTSTSVLALAPGFRPSAPWLRDEERLGIGAHLAAVGEDPPLLSAREIPTLVDRRGRLPISWRRLLPRLLARRVDPADIAREFAAQLGAIRSEGLTVDHLDTHQHVHLWPGVREVVLDLAVRAGVPAVRVTRSNERSLVGSTVRRFAKKLEAEARVDGLAFPGDAAGLDEAGRLDTATAVTALDRLAASAQACVELSAHPGAHDDPDRDRYRWNYRWGAELDALCAPEVRATIDRHAFRLGTYADIPRAVLGSSTGTQHR